VSRKEAPPAADFAIAYLFKTGVNNFDRLCPGPPSFDFRGDGAAHYIPKFGTKRTREQRHNFICAHVREQCFVGDFLCPFLLSQKPRRRIDVL